MTNDVARWSAQSRSQVMRWAVVGTALVAVMAASSPLRGRHVFPDLIQLPANFGPEGIAVGNGHTFYVGSLSGQTPGQILAGDLRTGEFAELVPPTGRFAVGMKFDPRSGLLFVAGGTSGRATVYDAGSGVEVAFYQFLPPGVPGINDVALARDAVYFTDTTRPFLGRIGLDAGGRPGSGTLVPLPANFGVPGPCTVGPSPRGNGVVASHDGDHLLLVHMSEGRLYQVDTTTHALTPVAIAGGDAAGGAAMCSTDGMLLDGQRLYAAQFALNRIAVIELAPDHLSGVITRYITEPFASNPALRLPTTLATFGDALYAVTYGGGPPSPDYVVRIEK